jgi:3-hydroxyisobutyrate dehydrogenase-like beta-hydroxyacid dehydrogenase
MTTRKTMPPSIGFIGFGEAGFNIAKGLRSAGASQLSAFDINSSHPALGPLIQQRAMESQVPLLTSPAEVAAAGILFSAVTASSALDAARQIAGFLRPHHIYADLNSISPNQKREVAEVVHAAGANFVEAAVMAPVPPYGHRVPILLGGPSAQRLLDSLSAFDMRLEVVSGEIGTAAAVKCAAALLSKAWKHFFLSALWGRANMALKSASSPLFRKPSRELTGRSWRTTSWDVW